MSVYCESMSNTPRDETSTTGENCYTCNNDCMGILLELLKEGEYQ